MNKDGIKIRIARLEDSKEILDIYSYYVKNTAITFEYEVPSLEEFEMRMKKTLEKFPYLVAVKDNEVLGYAYTGTFKDRSAYDWSVEATIYLKNDSQKKGIGRLLYEELEKISKKQNILNINACIAYPEIEDEFLNRNSVEFHKYFGFKEVGIFHNSGYKFSNWYNMIWLEKIIGEHKKNPSLFINFPNLEKNQI